MPRIDRWLDWGARSQRYRLHRPRLLGALYTLAAVRGLSADVPFAWNGRAAGSLALWRAGQRVLRCDRPAHPAPLSIAAVHLLCRGPGEPEQLVDDAGPRAGLPARPLDPRAYRSIHVRAWPDGLPGHEAHVLRSEFRTDRRCGEEQACILTLWDWMVRLPGRDLVPRRSDRRGAGAIGRDAGVRPRRRNRADVAGHAVHR